MNDALVMLNFAGLFILLLANTVQNFYQSKKTYRLLELVGEGLVIQKEKEKKKTTVDKMIEEGMEIEGRTE